MKVVKIDPLLAEWRPYEVGPYSTKQYKEIICPFCGWHNLFYFRNLAKGVRCSTCRALHMGSHRQAMRDIVPADEAAHIALDGRVEA